MTYKNINRTQTQKILPSRNKLNGAAGDHESMVILPMEDQRRHRLDSNQGIDYIASDFVTIPS